MLHRYLNWVGYNTKSFNAGDYRRKVCDYEVLIFSVDTLEKELLFLTLKTLLAPS